jgi:2-polyprenyl-3-methyl-5-hydroxy-6-metoxy-1,4-benzoquinol methylase
VLIDGRAYSYDNAQDLYQHAYLRPALAKRILAHLWPNLPKALDYGSGNGALTAWIAEQGFITAGVDISTSGVALAQEAHRNVDFSNDVSAEYLRSVGPFDLITCLEVLPHTYRPRIELEKLFDVMRPGAVLMISTPYHGYLKLLALALTGKMEKHLDTRWSGAHLHFFTPRTLGGLLSSVGFRVATVDKVGRIAPLAKSMLVTAVKPH